MFLLITGKPGASKTSHAIDMALNDSRLSNVEGTKRPVYYRGIRDLSDDLGWVELTDEQAIEWDKHCPDGALVIIDEAQHIFPTRGPSRPVPPGVQALETHRHRGFDVLFITQDPGLLDTNARRLANEQYHFERPFGAAYCIEYHSGTGYFNPNNKSELNQLSKRRRGLPKNVWGLYKSAEVHTHKFRIPPMLVIFPLLLIGIVVLAWFTYRGLSQFGQPEEPRELHQAPGRTELARPAGQVPETTRLTWAEALTPEIPSLPYTAPLYDEQARQPKSIPRVAGCIDRAGECSCYTQQGTVINGASESFCRNYIKNGAYDHLVADVEPEPRYVQGKNGQMESLVTYRYRRAAEIYARTGRDERR